MSDLDFNAPDDFCAVCRAPIVAQGMSWSKKYCGKRCYWSAVNAKIRERRAAARADLRCVWCGEPMESKRNDRKYCSPDCTHAAWRDHHRERLREYHREYQRRRRAKMKRMAPELAPDAQGLDGTGRFEVQKEGCKNRMFSDKTGRTKPTREGESRISRPLP